MDLKKLIKEIVELNEMAMPEKEVRAKVKALSEPIVEHILKVLMYQEQHPELTNHWCSEINSWLNRCVSQRIKGKKLPNETQLFKWLTEYFQTPDDIEGLKWSIEQKYGKVDTSLENLHKEIIKFFKAICPEVAGRQHSVTFIKKLLTKETA